MYRIAMNVALGRLRQKKRRRTRTDGLGADQDGPGILDGSPHPSSGPLEQAQTSERALLVREALGRLDDQQRALLVMRDVDGMDYQQIAEVMEAPLGTIKSRIFRSRLALRDQLKDYMSQA
jgi:RNA polymerase sigma-70 factor (ECF subfamily)